MFVPLLSIALLAFPDTARFAPGTSDVWPEPRDSVVRAEVISVRMSAAAVGGFDPDTLLAPPVKAVSPLMLAAGPTQSWLLADTVKKKPALVAYSDWYGRRLTLHKALSWTMLPLFAVSYYTGDRLLRDGRRDSPEIVRQLHPIAAGGAAVIFGVNTITGLWNNWDSRKDPEGRTRRIIHSLLFLAADAGFAYAGSLGDEAGEEADTRNRHRAVAISSMGVSTLGWVIMLVRR